MSTKGAATAVASGAEVNNVNEKITSLTHDDPINEKTSLSSGEEPGLGNTDGTPDSKQRDHDNEEGHSDDTIIITGADVANNLMSLRDDGEPALTFRSLLLATLLSGFQAAVNQIYQFKPTYVTIQGTFIVLIAYFLGELWALALPRGEKLKAKWRKKHGEGNTNYPLWIKIAAFINTGPWNLKEHAICAITASSASNSAATTYVFSAQNLFYDLPLSGTTVVLTIISVGLFGYGLAGLMRPICVWHVESVFWSNLPIAKTLQGLHWQKVDKSKPLRVFWYCFTGMFLWEFLPGYAWPWLNSISIPCLAAMKATGNKAAVLQNVFGGSLNNEGVGLFSISLDWQYITSAATAFPLKLQYHQAVGLFVCYIAMLGIYYGNGWDAKAQPFMSTQLRSLTGERYPTQEVFVKGILDESALANVGPPRLAATFAYAMFIANAAIGAMIAQFFFFWGKDVWRSLRGIKDTVPDRHHQHMVKTYKEVPWWWYISVLVISFIFGLIVVLKEDVTLSAGGYVISLVIGSVIAPMSALLYARFGNGIATNNLSKMIGGLIVPGRPIANMYFATWSHSVIIETVNMSSNLKLGEYLKIAPRVMFLTQIYGTVIGGFVNYAVMISILNNNRATLIDGNGDAGWSGATIQAFNTNAASWALSKYLYKTGAPYSIVPIGLAIGFGLVAVHRLIVYLIPRIGKFRLDEINLPQFIQYAGYIPYNQSQSCILFSTIIAGFYTQFYLRNYKPRIFKDYMYMITGGLDGAAFIVLFILSFAVFGAGGTAYPMPQWWGNNINGNYDLCPSPDS